jgi:hypothetical protein
MELKLVAREPSGWRVGITNPVAISFNAVEGIVALPGEAVSNISRMKSSSGRGEGTQSESKEKRVELHYEKAPFKVRWSL